MSIFARNSTAAKKRKASATARKAAKKEPENPCGVGKKQNTRKQCRPTSYKKREADHGRSGHPDEYGKTVYRGKRGGHYVLGKNDKRRYLKRKASATF